MGKVLFYGPMAVVLTIGGWYYAQGEQAPDGLLPIIVVLFAVMSIGYGIKSDEDGEIGKIQRDRTPRIFRIARYINHLITGILLMLAVYLLVR